MKFKYIVKTITDIFYLSCFVGFVFLASAIDQAQAASVPTQSVRVSNSPTVFIAPNQNVSVSGTVTTSITGTPNVSVTNTPTVSISGTPNVSVTNTPTVSISGTPNVSVTGWTGTDKGTGNISASTMAVNERSAATSISTGAVTSPGANVRRLTVSGSAPSAGRKALIFYTTTTAQICYFGSSGVTTSNGLQIPVQTEATTLAAAWLNAVKLFNDSNDYYFVSSNNCTVKIMEVY